MDTDFQIVGIRNTEDQAVSRHKKWYQGKPLISALLLAVILSGCLKRMEQTRTDSIYSRLYPKNICG